LGASSLRSEGKEEYQMLCFIDIDVHFENFLAVPFSSRQVLGQFEIMPCECLKLVDLMVRLAFLFDSL
jgi:hypothetical protein